MFTPPERDEKLNTLLDSVTDTLASVGVSVTRTPDRERNPSAATVLELDAGGTRGHRRYPVVIKQGRLDPPVAMAMALPPERPLLVIAPHVPDTVAAVLRERGVDHADASGNVRLEWDRMLIDVRGRRPRAKHAPSRDSAASRAFTRSGAMVVLALLSWADLAARPVRDIAHASGTSVGTAHTVMNELAGAGYLYQGTQGARLNRGGELLDRWAEAYTVTLARKLPIAAFTLDRPERLAEAEHALLAEGAQLGGELAASRIDPRLHPLTSTFYVDALPAGVLARFRMRQDDDGALRFRRRFWNQPTAKDPMVPSPLVYADLLASGDPRQREHAERIRGVDDRLVELDRA